MKKIGVTPYQCSLCSKSYSLIHVLNNHMRIHTGEKPYQCNQCGNAYSTKYGLISHVRIHTGENPYKCSLCNKCFSNNSGLSNHKRIHSRENVYKCNKCNEALLSNSDMLVHMKVHHGNNLHQCNQCSKVFSQTNELKRHHITHTCDKPKTELNIFNKQFRAQLRPNQYKSNKIEKASAENYTTGNLSCNIPITEKIYQCNLCKEAFLELHHLMNHIKVHSDDKDNSANYDEHASFKKAINVKESTQATSVIINGVLFRTSMVINGKLFRIIPKNDPTNTKHCDYKFQALKTRNLVGQGTNYVRNVLNNNCVNSAFTSEPISDNVMKNCEDNNIKDTVVYMKNNIFEIKEPITNQKTRHDNITEGNIKLHDAEILDEIKIEIKDETIDSGNTDVY